MSEELAIEILKQATLETTTGACEKCPRKDKSKTCIGCLNEAKEKMLSEIERLNTIINEINSIVEYWGYDKEHNDISSFRMAMKNIKDVLGSDKE